MPEEIPASRDLTHEFVRCPLKILAGTAGGQLAAQCLRKVFSCEASLATSVTQYQREYSRQFVPLLSAASRVRRLLALPVPARALAFELLRIPGLVPLIIRKTRKAG